MIFQRKISPPSLVACFLSVAVVFAVYGVSDRVYERMPHFEDEMAYVWQAQAIAGGQLALPSPPQSKSFLTPFVIDYHGLRFSKYPPGWPTVLALGIASGLRDWINPLLAGWGLWLLYRLARRITSPTISLLAVLLMLTSPMFWLLSASLLSHAWSLVVTLGFVLAWLDTFSTEGARDSAPAWLTAAIAGLSLGVLALTRPMTAVGVGLPFFVHGLVLLASGDKSVRIRVLSVGVLAALVGGLLFGWQFAVTGDPLHNPYTLWWKYDKIGFGLGYGRWEDGHNLEHAWYNIRYSLGVPGTGGDMLGWGSLWWLFMPFGLWVLRRKPSAWLAAGILPGTLLAYVPYWIGSWQYGPRYYYEGMISVVLLNAAGVGWLAGERGRLRKALTMLALIVLVGANLLVYLPARLWKMHGMYGITRSMLEPFSTQEARQYIPALVIVHWEDEWTEYGGLLELQNAQLDTPFIFAIHRNAQADEELSKAFSERQVIHYYPSEPFTFYLAPVTVQP
ncbi:MAG: hypothetical protein Fur0043_15230 [Anaerolineales bacterium]